MKNCFIPNESSLKNSSVHIQTRKSHAKNVCESKTSDRIEIETKKLTQADEIAEESTSLFANNQLIKATTL